MNLDTLKEHLALEEAGEPFTNPELEARRQAYIASIVDMIIEENSKALERAN